MKRKTSGAIYFLLAASLATGALAGPKDAPELEWNTVVNNNDLMPPLLVRNFNSYNQPSVNKDGLVVIRARSRGGPPLGPPTHGIYARDMSNADSEIYRVLDRSTRVPGPNNLQATFVETPAFPRIDSHSGTIAVRGNHKPVHRYHLADGTETRVGTTGIYTNPFGNLITGAAKLGDAPGLGFYGVPEFTDIRFEVFPGAPAVTGGSTIVFKGNYTVGNVGKTGVYFRELRDEPSGGDSPAVLIANNTDTLIPGTRTVFGSTAPPSADLGRAVFVGFDNEDAPTLGGIYAAKLHFQSWPVALVEIGGRIPDSKKDRFTALGEGVAFDGRHVGFWGAWGKDTRTVRLYCREEGNRDVIDYCNQRLVCSDTAETLGDPNSVCDDVTDPYFGSRCYVNKEVPVNQGFFVHDIKSRKTYTVAKTGSRFDEFLFWNYSGKPPCSGNSHSDEGGDDDGELVRWRSSAFVAVGGKGGASFNAVFKARTRESVHGIYLKKGPGLSSMATVLDTTMAGQDLDPEAPKGSRILELGVEREGMRGDWLAVNASMGVEDGEDEDGMAGIYVARIK